MARLDDEQQAALRKFKQDALGVLPPEAGLSLPTTQSPMFADRGHLPVPEVARVVGCQVADVLKIRRGLGHPKTTPASRLTVAEAEAVREQWNAPDSAVSRPTVSLALLATELDVDVQLLALEARRSGIPVRGNREAFMLFEFEADRLRQLAASRPDKMVWRTRPPVGSIQTPALATKAAHQASALADHTRQQPAYKIDSKAGNRIPLAPQRTSFAAPRLARLASTTIPSAGALTPPKPAAVVDIQRALVARSKAVELDPESKPTVGGVKVLFDVPPMTSAIGKGSSEVDALRQTLGGFAPKDHAVLFRELSAVLDLDEKIVRSFPAITSSSRLTDRALRSLMRLVCHGKFGLFAYHEVSNNVRASARKNGQASTPAVMANALTNLRPMHTGVLTDLGKSRFIFWHVEQNGTTLAIITFSAVTDWVFGIDRGQYVPLRGRLIAVARGTRLGVDDREDAQFMVEAAIKLRKGAHVQRSSPTADQPRARNYLDSPGSHTQRNLTYKPHSDWLIPVVIEDGFVTGGLREGFFSNYGGRTAHGVRSFVRRAPGSSANDPKTVHVSAHTRGGYDVGDIGFMPTVTILRDK